MTPTDAMPRIGIPTLWQTYGRMIQIADERAPQLRSSLISSALSAIFQGLALACLYPILSAVLREPFDVHALWVPGGMMLLFALLDWVLRWHGHTFGYSRCLADVTHAIRVRLGNQLRLMPLEELYQSRTGELSAVIAGNVDEVVTPMGMLADTFLRSALVPLVVVLTTALIEWRLALAMLLLFPVTVPLYRWRKRLSGGSMRTLAAAHARTSAEIIEYTQGLAVLRSANATGVKARRLQESLVHLQDVQARNQWSGLWPSLVIWTLIEGGIILILALGVVLVAGGSLSIAMLAALLIITVRISEPLAIMTNLSAVFDYMEAGFEQVEKLLAVKPLPCLQPSSLPTRFDVRFEGVSFQYAGTEGAVLSGLDLHLPERSLTALVGPSGSGKTTITRLLMRYADPQQGRIMIGGNDIRAMEPEELMACISVVFQDVYLFDDTILANIRMGRCSATDAEVEAAARAACCHEFISRLPLGYQTRVGDIGGSLSGGERQRISIARALLKDAPIVMLDEPTAALDTESELSVQQAIDTLVQDRTVIVIAHRLSTIVGAERILVLEDGKLVEQGTHEHLLDAGGRYRAMWNAQQSAKSWHLAVAAGGDSRD
ncbi:ABC transporter ATP-binding protein/permease [Desulfurispirillum indicum]|uniref:ABC transporter ATP-binding protein n=1 Tax=Desulfurispirillum indicum TaxID=936456 RepID=UPI001CFA53D4|nr:ABC transporter ATP-binding protein [Desulfurispirillum indicum]UCZ55954.1 ABC transporter ATP-binding protein/permease [Desulfurispirillum indicum]